MEIFTQFGYAGLFAAAFLAATILPLSSEIVLTGLLLAGLPPVALVCTATAGNVLGALLNYALGYWASMGVIKKWLKISEDEFLEAQHRFEKYGIGSLCFAWLPVVGDPLTLIAGVLRIHWTIFVLLVTLGKCLRYVVIAWLVLKAG